MNEISTPPQNVDSPGHFLVTGEPGDLLYREGEEGNALYIVQHGEIELLQSTAQGDRTVATRTRGEFLGELSVLHHVPREATARATTQYAAYKIDRATLDTLIHEEPQIALAMLQSLSREIGELRSAALHDNREAAMMPAGHSVLLHEDSGTEFDITANEETTIGRIDRRTGHTPDIDLTTYDEQRTLSRNHAKIKRRNGTFYLTEERVTLNGTFINESPIGGEEQKLTHGDVVQCGDIRLVFMIR